MRTLREEVAAFSTVHTQMLDRSNMKVGGRYETHGSGGGERIARKGLLAACTHTPMKIGEGRGGLAWSRRATKKLKADPGAEREVDLIETLRSRAAVQMARRWFLRDVQKQKRYTKRGQSRRALTTRPTELSATGVVGGDGCKSGLESGGPCLASHRRGSLHPTKALSAHTRLCDELTATAAGMSAPVRLARLRRRCDVREFAS